MPPVTSTPSSNTSNLATRTSCPQTGVPPIDGYLVCKGPHWLKDCPTATQAQRDEAIRKYRETKAQKLASMRSKAARYSGTTSSVRINGLIEMPYSLDTAADQSVMPQDELNSLRAMQPTLEVLKLPVAMEAVMANGQTQMCVDEVLLDLELATVAGSVASLRSVPCLVLAGDGDEFLLGREVFKGLGIDDEVDEFPVGDEIPLPPGATETENSLDQLIKRAVTNGLPVDQVGALRELVAAFPDIWRDGVGPGPPADVEPLRVTVQPDAVPYRSQSRKYAPLQAQYIRDYVKTLVDNGLVDPNNASRWACAVVPVHKPGTRDKFRLTIDYRPANNVTIPIAGGMPSAASLLDAFENFKNKKVFGRVDFTRGFWQIRLHEDSREMFSIITPDGVFTSTRVPQGGMDSELHFQNQVQAKLAPLIPHSAIVWVDDVLLFAPTVYMFLKTLRTYFEIVHKARFKLNMANSSLFEVEILLCGRLISGEGVRHDPTRVIALAILPLPVTVADLQYFVCTTNWLHDSLPDYARMIAPLQDKLNAERSRIGRRNRNALNVATTRSANERAIYDAVVALVADSALMTFPDANAELLLFTDASATGYGIIVTQARDWDAALPVDRQHHELVICKGGTFKHSERNWSVPKGSRLFCDHANLAYIFPPDVELKKHVRDRLQRWAMRLCGLHYTIEHFPGEKHVWADIVSRWNTRATVQIASVQTRSHQSPPVSSLSRLRPLDDENFVFPSREDIKVAQEAASRERSRLNNFSEEEDGVVTIDHRIWIPTAAHDLLARIFVVSHCGTQGHRGQEPMLLVLKNRFHISRLEDKLAKFVRKCLLCKHFKGPRQIRRPYGPLLTPVRRNEIVHWDYLTLGEGFGDSSYLLVVNDGISHFCELFPCGSPTAYIAAEALTLWHARYGLPDTLLSDQ
ncbi:Hypothetical protein PHPALM_6210 [Phytophthora palmivora]|uniref:Integrase catalytic domain-containing protein n=1 Tax=Phytophthora palmivora TaxID=4796 RepID=A0A2P4YFG5_9STRA|nr:Hypothetical protein PHPALM_6210 [Phytophthora palmivora]